MNPISNDVISTVANIWKALCEDLPEERRYSSATLAEKTKISQHAAGRAMRFLRGLGILSYRSVYGAGTDGGQVVYMSVTTSVDNGLTAIYKHFDSGRSYSWFESKRGDKAPEKANGVEAPVAIATKPAEVTRAIAGPEPETPMKAALQPVRRDEAEALVEAARQYSNRGAAVQAKISELSALGVTVDADMLAKAIHFEVDERLETVASILPIIDRLYRINERLTTEVAGLKSELKNTSDVRSKVASLQAANKRLSERNVALAGQVAAQSESHLPA